MSLYLGRLQSISKLDIVITSGINTKDYANKPVYDKAVFYSDAQVLSGSVDVILKKATAIEVSHLSRQSYREVGIYLRRLFADEVQLPDIYVPDRPCITTVIVGDLFGNPKNAFIPTDIDDGVDLDFDCSCESYDIPDEEHDHQIQLMVTEDGTIISSKGNTDYVQTVACLSYGKIKDFDDAYFEVINDDDYVYGQPPIPVGIRVEPKGGLPAINGCLWSDLNRLLLREYAIAYVPEASQYAVLHSSSRFVKYRHRGQGYVFFDSEENVSDKHEMIGAVESIPISNLFMLMFARMACRNLGKRDPRFEAYLHFNGGKLPVEWNDESQTLSVGNYRCNFKTLKRELLESQKEERKMGEKHVVVKEGRPLHEHDYYVADFAKMANPLCKHAAVMHTSTHPMEQVITGKFNTKLHKELYVNFAGVSEERELATKFLDYLEEFISAGNVPAYDIIYIEPGTITSDVFACTIES